MTSTRPGGRTHYGLRASSCAPRQPTVKRIRNNRSYFILLCIIASGILLFAMGLLYKFATTSLRPFVEIRSEPLQLDWRLVDALEADAPLDYIKKIIQESPDTTSFVYPGGRKTIHYVSQMRRPDVLEYLLSLGQDPDEPVMDSGYFGYGFTPLHFAIIAKDDESVRVLLSAGATGQSEIEETPSLYDFAKKAKCDDCISVLNEYGIENESLSTTNEPL